VDACSEEDLAAEHTGSRGGKRSSLDLAKRGSGDLEEHLEENEAWQTRELSGSASEDVVMNVAVVEAEVVSRRRVCCKGLTCRRRVLRVLRVMIDVDERLVGPCHLGQLVWNLEEIYTPMWRVRSRWPMKDTNMAAAVPNTSSGSLMKTELSTR